MWTLLRSLRYRALGVAFFFCYIVPSILVWLVLQVVLNVAPAEVYTVGGWAALFGLWAVFLGPFAAGYMAASLAKIAPLAHGFGVSVVGGIVYLAILNAIPGLWLALLMLFLLLSGFSGAWLYRWRSQGIVQL